MTVRPVFTTSPFFGGCRARVIKCTPGFPIFSDTRRIFPLPTSEWGRREVTFHCSAVPPYAYVSIHPNISPQLFHSPHLILN